MLCLLSPHSRKQGETPPTDRTGQRQSGQLSAVGSSTAGGGASAGQNSSSQSASSPSSVSFYCSGGESCHLQGDALPQLFGLLASLQVLQHVVELHHTHGCQAESAAGAADDVDEVVVVRGCQVDEPVVDVLWRQRDM